MTRRHFKFGKPLNEMMTWNGTKKLNLALIASLFIRNTFDHKCRIMFPMAGRVIEEEEEQRVEDERKNKASTLIRTADEGGF